MSDDVPVQISPLRSDDRAAFAAMIEIYQASIVGSERKDAEQLAQMLRRDEYRFLLAKNDEAVLGFAILYRSPEQPFDLLEYLAVAAEARNAGIGSALIRAIQGQLAGRNLVVEVDAPTSGGIIETMRERFYRRLGCRRVEELDYILPLPGDPPPMVLMIDSPADEFIGRAMLRRWVEEIYGAVYDCPRDDPRIERMFGGLPMLLRLS